MDYSQERVELRMTGERKRGDHKLEWKLKRNDTGNFAHISTAVPVPIAEAMERYGPILAAQKAIDTSTPYSVCAYMITQAVMGFMAAWEKPKYDEFLADEKYARSHRSPNR